MLLREVEYARPTSFEDVLRLLSEHEGARALAGGQTLINVMKARAASPDVLVDLNGLEDLRGIELAGDGTLTIGAMTTYTDIVGSAEARARPILGEGRMTIASENGERVVPAEEFFLGVYLTAVGPGELLTRVEIPAGRQDGFAAVTPGTDGTCIANAAASGGGGVGVALGCVDAVPVVLHPDGQDDEAVRAAVQGAGLQAPADVHASSDYRAHLAGVLAVRAVQQALERA